jgi:predicted ATPase/DNA-binding NarL/FixJ family response regulator/Tfp pilus assembly protein PilF
MSAHLRKTIASSLSDASLPLITPDQRLTNIPSQSTVLIGRDEDVTGLVTFLRRADMRLVTLTGPGGVGKTRLGLQVATNLLSTFEDGVFFVSLAPIHNYELVAGAIAQTFAIPEVGAQHITERLSRYLRDKQILLLLDNFEHVIAAAPLVAELLSVASALKVIVTSREALRISGEHEFVVPSLMLPNLACPLPLEQIAQSAAVRLFIERSQAVKADFAVTAATVVTIAEICHRLDGLPLAIELAAVRSKLFAPQELLSRLDRQLDLLTGGVRNIPKRQQTLRNTINWSYELLTAEEQVLFARLAVFADSWTLEAVEAVCGDTLPMQRALALEVGVDVLVTPVTHSPSIPSPLQHPSDRLLELLASLVDKSLVQRRMTNAGNLRFTMLQVMREYARERLETSDVVPVLRRRHIAYYLALAEAANPELEAARSNLWLMRLEEEYDNLRAAFYWALEHEAIDMGARLSSALRPFWRRLGYLSEGRRWLNMVLARHNALTPDMHAQILLDAAVLAELQGDYTHAYSFIVASLKLWREIDHRTGIAHTLRHHGWIAFRQGDYDNAERLAGESLAYYRELSDLSGIAATLSILGVITTYQGNYTQAETYYEESLTGGRELGNLEIMARALNNFGILKEHQGDFTGAQRCYEESLRLKRELGNKGSVATALLNLGIVTSATGDIEQSLLLIEESLALNRELEDRKGIAYCLNTLSEVIYYQGDYTQAAHFAEQALTVSQELNEKLQIAAAQRVLGMIALRGSDYALATQLLIDSLTLFLELGYGRGIATTLNVCATLAVAQDNLVCAAMLCGAAEALRETIGASLSPLEKSPYEELVMTIRTRGDSVACKAAWIQGRTMAPEQVVAAWKAASTLAPSILVPHLTDSNQPNACRPELTTREVEVLRLMTNGLTNKQIAEQLHVSRTTINAHLRSIYGKLGVTTRAAATRLAVEQNLC